MHVKFEWTFPDSVIFLPHSYLVIAVWLFAVCILENLAERRMVLVWKMIFVSYQNTPQRKGLSSRTCTR